MSKVLFVGSNPSQKSNSVTPFWHDAKSTKILSTWTSKLELENVIFCFANVSNFPTPDNRPLLVSEIKASLPILEHDIRFIIMPHKIVALGKTAEKALTLLRLDFYAMPHPSGLNRLLNDPAYVEEKIKGLKLYLNPSTSFDITEY